MTDNGERVLGRIILAYIAAVTLMAFIGIYFKGGN